MANTIASDIQSIDSGNSPLIELFTLDLSVLGGAVYHFTPNVFEANGNLIAFAGVSYTPIPMDFSGWEVLASASGGSSTQPRPTLAIGNASKLFLNVVISLGDMVGATVTRIRTMLKYCDGQPNADTSQILQTDIYRVAQKTSHTNQQIVWMLTNPLDNPNAQIPARQVLKDPTSLSNGFPGVQVYS